MAAAGTLLKTYCIIGDPVSHSLSPLMQNAAFSAMRLDCTYISFRVPEGELRESVESLREMKIAGFNVTVPHKVAVMQYLDSLDATAGLAGAVNTVSGDGSSFVGYNTDIEGFLEPLRRRSISLAGARVLLIGAGGAARAVVAGLRDQGIGQLTIANKDLGRGEALKARSAEMGIKSDAIGLSQAELVSSSCDLIVNATTLGMKGEPSPVSSERIRKGTVVYDIVYRPVYTPLIQNAKKAQAVVIFGYEMLLEQGAKAFEIWIGKPAPREAMKRSLLGFFGEPA